MTGGPTRDPIRSWVCWALSRVLLIAALTFLIGAGVLWVIAEVSSPAAAEDCIFGAYGCGHHENHEQYKSWTREPSPVDGNRMSCCSDGDCRPVKARQMDDGRWQWWNGERWSLPVPPEAMLKPDILGDGRSHACGPKPVPYFNNGDQMTYCFSPAQLKM